MNLTQVLARATFVVGDKRQGMDSARNYSLSVLKWSLTSGVKKVAYVHDFRVTL